jgi:hypothetical protein
MYHPYSSSIDEKTLIIGSAMSLKTFVFITVFVSLSCSPHPSADVNPDRHGWGKIEERTSPICRERILFLKTQISSAVEKNTLENETFAFIVNADVESMTRECAATLARTLEPCVLEFDFGTDSAIQCASRYVDPALRDFLYLRCVASHGLMLTPDVTAASLPRVMTSQMKNLPREQVNRIGLCGAFGG